MPRIADLDELLKAAGVPISGISGSGVGAVIQFLPEATDSQRAQAATILAAFDWGEDSEEVELRKAARRAAAADSVETMVQRAVLKKILRPALKGFADVLAAYRAEIIRLGGIAANLPAPPNVRSVTALLGVLQDAIAKGHGEASRLGTENDA